MTNINILQSGVACLYSLKTSKNLKGFLILSGDIDKQRDRLTLEKPGLWYR